MDRKAARYAWLWVFPGGYKLRAPSIKGAAFVGSDVKVLAARDFAPHGADDDAPHDVTIDLATGKATLSAK